MFLDQISWKYGVLGVFVAFWAQLWIRRAKSNHAIKALGGRAPVVRTMVPLSLDFTYYAVTSFFKYTALDFWIWIFTHTGGASKQSYTAEVTILSNLRVVFTADVENIKAILTTQFNDYGKSIMIFPPETSLTLRDTLGKGENFHKEWVEFLGNSIFNSDNKQWHDSRQMIRPIFTRDRVGDLDVIEIHVKKLLSQLGPGDGRMIKFDKLLSRFTLDAATHFLLGRSVGSLDEEVSIFQDAFDEVQRVQSMNVRAGPLTPIMPQGGFKKGLKIMDTFMAPYIQQALALSPEELETKLSKSDTFIHSLARYTRDPKLMRDQLTAILLAGRDTTASSMSWVFLELARNPRVVTKLRTEIAETVGTSGRAPSYQQIKDMKYLTYIINETLRLYPVVPYNVREALADTSLPHGAGPDGLSPVGVQAGTPIGYSTLLMQRRRDLYPPISESFPYDPSDWVPERWATWVPKPWQFIPFNGGPRICIGQQFAMVEMGYTIVRVFQEFDSLVDFGNTPVLKAEIVLTPGEGVKIGFVKAKQ